jgi:hypothetical protein
MHHVTVGHSVFVPFTSCHPDIYLERLRKTTKIFRIVGVPTDVRTRHHAKRSRLSQLACCYAEIFTFAAVPHPLHSV